MRTIAIVVVWSLAAVFAMQNVQAEESLEIGSVGARLNLDADWNRTKLNNDLGPDQFILFDAGYFYMVLHEDLALLETEADFHSAVDTGMALLAAQGGIKRQGKLRYSRRRDFGHAGLMLDVDLHGLKVTYSFNMLARDGLQYTIMLWSMRSDADRLEQVVDEVVDGFSFPPPDSTWDRESVPTTVTHRIRNYELSFDIRRSVFDETDGPQRLVSYDSKDEYHGIYVFENDLNSNGLDEELDAILEAINRGETAQFVEKARTDFVLGEFKGRRLICESDGSTGQLIAVPLPDNRCLDIRYIHAGAPDSNRFDRDLFLKSLSLDSIDPGISLPELAEPETELHRNAIALRLWEKSDLLVATDFPTVREMRRLSSGGVLVADWRRMALIRDGKADQLYSTEEWMEHPRAVRWDNRWLVATDSGEVVDAQTNASANLDLKARLLDASPDYLYVVPLSQPPEIPGLDLSGEQGPDVLQRMAADGRVETLASFGEYRLSLLGVAPDERHALVAGTAESAPESLPYGEAEKLLLVDLSSGNYQVLGPWDSIDGLIATQAGWLVTGAPDQRARGIYRVSNDGDLQILLTGDDYRGVDLTDDTLFYAGSTTGTDGNVQALYRIALDDLASDGPLCQPFCAAIVNQVAEAWAEQQQNGAPEKREDVQRQFDAASEICKSLIGRQLPTEPNDVDQYCDVLLYADRLSVDAKRLSALVITNSLLLQGAEWVPAPSGDASTWTTAGTETVSSTFAVGYTPSGIFTDTFYNGEGMWNPASSLMDSGGRTVFVGHSLEAIQQAVERAKPALPAEWMQASRPEPILSVLNQVPDNTFFREATYKKLAATGRLTLLEAVAQEFAQRNSAAAIDVTTWLAVRQQQCTTDAERHALATDIRSAIDEYPREASLYLLLGIVLEQTEPPPHNKSRACYNRVLELTYWGATHEAATNRLERLDTLTP